MNRSAFASLRAHDDEAPARARGEPCRVSAWLTRRLDGADPGRAIFRGAPTCGADGPPVPESAQASAPRPTACRRPVAFVDGLHRCQLELVRILRGRPSVPPLPGQLAHRQHIDSPSPSVRNRRDPLDWGAPRSEKEARLAAWATAAARRDRDGEELCEMPSQKRCAQCECGQARA